MTPLIRAEYGSRAYGTNTQFSDRDMVEIVLEEPRHITGLDTFETKMHHTAEDGQRSTKDDTDTTIYGLHKFVELASAGNPSILSVLFLGQESYEEISSSGQRLIDSRGLFVSKNAVKRHLGYMMGQRDAMIGARNKRTNRPELVHQFGFDTKFGYHMIRLGILGYELLTTGTMELPMHQDNITRLIDIREGRMTKDEVLEWSYGLQKLIEATLPDADLPEKSDRQAINDLLHTIYISEWRSM